jgi:hypothetical protein
MYVCTYVWPFSVTASEECENEKQPVENQENYHLIL